MSTELERGRASSRLAARIIGGALLTAPLLLAGLAGGCGRTEGTLPCSYVGCPCVFEADCDVGYDCVDRVCALRQQPDAGPDQQNLKEFGELCGASSECASGYCLPDLQGAFCSRPCDPECPGGWVCRMVPDPRGGQEPVGLCAVDRQRVCQPCIDDTSCNPSGGDRCLEISGQDHCARDCTFQECPEGYACTSVTHEGQQLRQCLPVSDTCACTEQSAGQLRGCERQNSLGLCHGQEICEPAQGWSECSAREPATESCNGLDDDCDADIDEGMNPVACAATAGDWSCPGTALCFGEEGYVCNAPTPEAEACDGFDNNCDGQVDEAFVDSNGIYNTKDHCGGCGIDCDDIIPFATATACVIDAGKAKCIATACQPGYFPYQDGSLCMQLPDNLCAPCASDPDCVGPGSRCIQTVDETYCGRSCGAQSAYGTSCPAGYICQDFNGSPQCVPPSGTCVCNEAQSGAVRSCHSDTCMGRQTCSISNGIWNWSACDISDNVEICDALDNDCDGLVDEGFLNPVTGRYDAVEHCGFCNNDCTKYWAGDVHHATGTCDSSQTTPQCKMQCLTETAGGVSYEWVNTNGATSDGCECRRVAGNLTQDEPDMGEFPKTGADYVDENCDGIDGVVEHALFVWAGNSQPGIGTRTNPFRTVAQALTALPGSGKRYILVAEGVYDENIVLFNGAALYGGYASDFLGRDILLHATILRGQELTTASEMAAVTAVGLGKSNQRTVLSGFQVLGRNIADMPPSDELGKGTIAVYAKDCGPGLVLQNNVIVAGRGGRGGRGSTGAAGYGRQVSTELDGKNAINGERRFGSCSNTTRLGGAGGVNSQCSDATASRGGGIRCPQYNMSTHQGRQAEYVNPTGGDGEGGYDWTFDQLSGFDCSHVTESGWPSSIQSHNGQDGTDGAQGAVGPGGPGCGNVFGSIVDGQWVSPPVGGQPGGRGAVGKPGGGGGGGGGTAFYLLGGCTSHELGPTGGGGGGGGCGADGGRAGGAGGASIAVFVSYTAAPAASQVPLIQHNRIRRGPGGDGGIGGFGGNGGQGGRGGFGGQPTTWSGSTGGKGGDGGNGGPGGGGGGGCGGPSLGLLGFNHPSFLPNEFDYDDTVQTGGAGGLGGGAAAAGSAGAKGIDGTSANQLLVRSCGTNGLCPTGLVCDPNQVCVPIK